MNNNIIVLNIFASGLGTHSVPDIEVLVSHSTCILLKCTLLTVIVKYLLKS